MGSVPCLYCNNVMKLGISGRPSQEITGFPGAGMHRHVNPRVVRGSTLAVDTTGNFYLTKPEVELLEWWLCPVCQTSWEMFQTAREEIDVAASNSIQPQ